MKLMSFLFSLFEYLWIVALGFLLTSYCPVRHLHCGRCKGRRYLTNADVVTEPFIHRTMRFLTYVRKGCRVGSFFEASSPFWGFAPFFP